MTALLRLRGASFGYDGAPVIEGVDLELRAGDFVAAVGPNGGGKTTLVRGILGLAAPLSGTVELLAESVGYVSPRDTLDSIFPLSVEEVVGLGERWGGPAREVRERARRCLETVGLSEEGGRFASLSGGQRQRALIARALMARPDLLVLDEPTSGVDREAQGEIVEVLTGLRERQNTAILLVTHQTDLIPSSARDVLRVGEGRVRRESGSK
jgi:zinc transport system ATP-binding protein